MSAIDSINASIVHHLRAIHPPHACPVLRDAHAKHHGCLPATLRIVRTDPGAEFDVQRGVFAEPGRVYPAWVRFSNALKVRHDLAPDARGVAIKLMGVAGSDSGTQDFLMVSHRTFFSYDAGDFVDFPATVCDATISLRSWGRIFGYFLRVRGRSRMRRFASFVRSLQFTDNPLKLAYGSQTPYLLGPRQLMKYSVRPHEPLTRREAIAIRWQALRYGIGLGGRALRQRSDLLRHALVDRLRQGAARFDFLVQVRERPDDPGERARLEDDAVTDWSETEFPHVKVAELEIPQLGTEFDEAATMEVGEHLSFTPWHTTADHRPLGSINHARRVVYERVSSLRHELNHVHRLEPAPYQSALDYLVMIGARSVATASFAGDRPR